MLIRSTSMITNSQKSSLFVLPSQGCQELVAGLDRGGHEGDAGLAQGPESGDQLPACLLVLSHERAQLEPDGGQRRQTTAAGVDQRDAEIIKFLFRQKKRYGKKMWEICAQMSINFFPTSSRAASRRSARAAIRPRKEKARRARTRRAGG